MAKLNIPYGKTTQQVNLDNITPQIVYPRSFEIRNEMEKLEDALENPLNSVTFKEFIENAENLLFIVNDATRPTPTARILEHILPMVKSKKLDFLVATGTHRAPVDSEYKFIFGNCLDEIKDNIHIHDAGKMEFMTYYGTSRRSTKFFFNNLLDSSKNIVTINSVEPHYYAGFTGGRKSFLPGISCVSTIEQNHKFALDDSAKSLILSGNPVHEDMMEAIELLQDRKIFSIQTVLDTNHRIYHVSAGNLNDSFLNCVDKALEVFSVKIKKRADIVVTCASYPLDINMYQAHKAIDNGKLALRKGGILILVAECRDGLGHDTFYDYLSNAKDQSSVISEANRNYKLGCHISANIAKITSENQIWTVTKLDEKYLEKMFMKPCKNLQEAVDDAIRLKEDPEILFLMQGSVTVPRIENN